MRVCTIDGCERKHMGRGWCGMHYGRWLRNGDPLITRRPHKVPPGAVCSVDGCGVDRGLVRGLCTKHYSRKWRYGSVDIVQRVIGDDVARLLSRMTVMADGCWIWHGETVTGGYGRIKVGGRSLLAHRFSYEIHIGPIPDGYEVDHLCNRPPCINPAHVQPVTPTEHHARTAARRRARRALR